MRQLKSHCFWRRYFQSWRINRLWTWVTLAVVAVPGACEDPCDHGWFYVSYEGSAKCYFISNSQRDFGDARDHCIRYMASLASIATKAESEALANLFRSNKNDERFQQGNYWIGLWRSGRTQPWEWLGGSEYEWQNWDDGEPERHDVCARAVYSDKLQWRGTDCHNTYSRICEQTPKNASTTLTTTTTTPDPYTTTTTMTSDSTTTTITTTTTKTTPATTTSATTRYTTHEITPRATLSSAATPAETTTPILTRSSFFSNIASTSSVSPEDIEEQSVEGDGTREVLVAIIGAGWVCAAILGSILIYCIVLYVRDNRRRLASDSAIERTSAGKDATNIESETVAAYENCL